MSFYSFPITRLSRLLTSALMPNRFKSTVPDELKHSSEIQINPFNLNVQDEQCNDPIPSHISVPYPSDKMSPNSTAGSAPRFKFLFKDEERFGRACKYIYDDPNLDVSKMWKNASENGVVTHIPKNPKNDSL